MRAEALLDLKDIKQRDKARKRRLHAVTVAVQPEVNSESRRRIRPLMVTAVVLLAIVATGALLLKRYAEAFSVQHVVIEGEFDNEQAREIEQVLKSHLAGDLFTVDLDSAHKALLQLPWIAGVRLQRAWPDKVRVNIREQVPVAYWNADRLINAEGVVFDKAYGVDLNSLPHLTGPEHKAGTVLKHYALLSDILARNNRQLVGLQVDARNSWTVRDNSGVTIRLGSHDIESRLSKLLSIVKFNTKVDWSKAASFDLRHSNGFAVSWAAKRDNPQG